MTSSSREGAVDSLPDMSPEPTPLAPDAPAPTVAAQPVEVPVGAWSIVRQLFVGVLLILAGQIVLGFCAGFVLAFIPGFRGEKVDPATVGQSVAAFLAGPAGMSVLVLLSEAVFLGVALFGVRPLPGTQRENLGLARPALPLLAYPLFAVGSIAVALFGGLLGDMVNRLIPSMLNADALRSQVTWTTGIPFVAIIALAPGFVEELLFRGYIQRRLLRRWRPRSAILFASVAFAVAHLDPTHVMFALPIGIWFGILAWRTNSIWPGVAGHMFVNALWNVWGICVLKLDLSDDVQSTASAIGAVCALVGFLGSIVMLRRMQPRAVVPAEPVHTPDATTE
jgi:membrane protease YdiL (CAAX protease family)